MLKETSLALAMRATKSHLMSAFILERIRFWYPRAKHEAGGHRWLVRTRAEFEAELGPIAEATYYRALKRLRCLGLIETMTGAHPFRAGTLRTNFIRLCGDNEPHGIGQESIASKDKL
jgi:hypothetical protein